MSATEPQHPSQTPPAAATGAGTSALVNGFTLQVSTVLELWFGNVVAQVLAHRFVTPTIQSVEALVLNALSPVRTRFVAVFEAMWSEGHNRGRAHAISTYGFDIDAGRLDAEIELLRKLDVHHISPARSFEDDAARNDESNLVALCQTCHSEWEQISPLRPQTPYFD